MRAADNELCELLQKEKYEKQKRKRRGAGAKKSVENTEIKRDKAHKANARHNGHLDRQIYR